MFNRKKYKPSLLPLAVFQRDTMECVISHMILELTVKCEMLTGLKGDEFENP